MGSYSHRRKELKELSSSFGYLYSSSKICGASSSLKWDQSPVLVFQGPISNNSYSRSSPPIKIASEKSDVSVNFQSSLKGTNRLFNGFVRHALGSCVDYDPALSYQVEGGGLNMGLSPVLGDELTFNMEENDNLVEDKLKLESYAKVFLADAQAKHRIFYDDFVVKAFHEVEKAHRGQMRASGDPYLQHCVETTVLLAKIGANSTVVAAGLLHDTLDDSCLSYDYIFRTFGAGVAFTFRGELQCSHGALTLLRI